MSVAHQRVLVIGASSQVGRFVLPRLLAAGCAVDALSRKAPPPDYPEFDDLRWIAPEQARLALGDYSHLVSAGPLALALDYANAMPALRALALTSSSSVLGKSDSPDEAEQHQVAVLREAEEGLRCLARERRLPLVLLRPTLIYGCGLDQNLTRIAAFIRRFGFLPISTQAGGLRQPVHADDVAQALVAGLAPRAQRELVSPLCGGDTVDYRGMVRRVFAALGRSPRFLALPPGVLAQGIALGRSLRLVRGVSPEMIYRQARNLVFDDQEARALLGVSPRRFHPGPDAFEPPQPKRLERLAERQS